MPPTIGIYKIVNKVTGKYYVGSSINTSRRWRDHVRDLTKNKHANDYLQRAWNKYGASVFEFVVVEVFPLATEKQLLLEEQKWLDIAVSDPLTYNLTFVAGSPNSNMSDYSKKKRSESLKRVPRTPEWKNKISKSHFGIRPNAVTLKKMSISKLGKKQSECQKAAATESRRRHWNFLSPTGEPIHIYDLKRFSREHGLNAGMMYWVSQGKRTHHKNWKAYPPITKIKYTPTFEHIKNAAEGHAKDYVFLSPNNEKINVHNLAKFCREHNLHTGTMWKVFHRHVITHRGWRAYEVQ